MSTAEPRMTDLRNNAAVIWSIADALRGPYKRSEYGHVILPLTLMRRLDQAMEDTKDAVVAEKKARTAEGMEDVDMLLQIAAGGRQFFNSSPLRFHQLPDDPGHIATNLRAYIDGYSKHVEAVFANFDFEKQIQKLEANDLLHAVISAMCEVDLHPDRVSNLEMGYTFEELIRKFAESSNDEAGAHFTPREVVRLMVNLLVGVDEEALSGQAPIRTVYDCACGTGGILSEAELHIKALNPNANVHLFGQEINDQSYAICLADMLIRGQDPSHIVRGNTLTHDGHAGDSFHYGIANPPFGTDWKAEYPAVSAEHQADGAEGRFAPGLPGKDDGQTLFLLQLLSKMKSPEDGGSRIAIIHNGSPLFSGGAGSGLSEIRRHVIENDLLEAVIALPEQLFYNTGIASYIWVLTNRKTPERQGKVQLIDARNRWVKMRKSLGDKRREISPEQIDEITNLHASFEASDGDNVKVLPNEAFAYRRITVERPLRGRWVFLEEDSGEVEETPATPKRTPGGSLAAKWMTRAVVKGVFEGLNGKPVRLRSPLAAAAAEAFKDLTPEQWENFRQNVADNPARMVELGLKPAYDTEAEAMEALKSELDSDRVKYGKAALKKLTASAFVRDESGGIVVDSRGRTVSDPALRDTETVPFTEDVTEFLEREVLPWVPDAYVLDSEGKIGYEIPLTRLFHQPIEQRPSDEIKNEIRQLESDFRAAIEGVLR